MPHRKAVNSAATTIAAASSALMTRVVRKARAVQVRRRQISPKKQFFCPANLSQSIATRPSLLHRLPPLPNRSPAANPQRAKRLLRARRALSPWLHPGPEACLAAFLAARRVGSSRREAPQPQEPPRKRPRPETDP